MQKCYNCGKEVDDNVLICPECGRACEALHKARAGNPRVEYGNSPLRRLPWRV